MDCEILALQRRFQETKDPVDEYHLRSAQWRLGIEIEPLAGDEISVNGIFNPGSIRETTYTVEDACGILQRRNKYDIWLQTNVLGFPLILITSPTITLRKLKLPEFQINVEAFEIQQAEYYNNLRAKQIIIKKHKKEELTWVESVIYLRVTQGLDYQEAIRNPWCQGKENFRPK